MKTSMSSSRSGEESSMKSQPLRKPIVTATKMPANSLEGFLAHLARHRQRQGPGSVSRRGSEATSYSSFRLEASGYCPELSAFTRSARRGRSAQSFPRLPARRWPEAGGVDARWETRTGLEPVADVVVHRTRNQTVRLLRQTVQRRSDTGL